MPGKRRDNSETLATHRVVVYHEAIKKTFASIEVAAEFGVKFWCKSMDSETLTTHSGIPTVAVLSMDYEEKSVMFLIVLVVYLLINLLHDNRVRAAAILGAKSGYPCPICLVPHDEQWRFDHDWPDRSQESANQLIEDARILPTEAQRKAKLATQSIRNLIVSRKSSI